ncbi:MAG: VWA domain-containing protein [Anaerofustis sp.]
MDEMNQREFVDCVPTIINASESHMACLLLVDTSGSMQGNPIDELNAALNKFKLEVCEDRATRDILDIAIVEFNNEPNVVQEFMPVEYMEAVKLTAQGGTNMAPAIELALNMVNERSRFYGRTGSQPYKPWVIMISDGYGGDIDEIAQTIRDMEENNKLRFFSLGVDDYDSTILHKLSGKKVMKLRGYDFTGFFDWVNKSMRSVSVSSPGETPKGVPLPENVDKDTDDWM